MTPPKILEVTVHPTQIDVSDGPATVIVSITVDDDLSGISIGELLFNDMTGGAGYAYIIPPTTGDTNYKKHVFTTEFPQFYPPETWHLLHAWIRDKVGNERAYSPGLLDELGLAASLEILPWEKEDNTPPELVEVTILSPEVDVSDAFVAVDIVVRAIDDDSGVAYVQLEFESPSGIHSATMFGNEYNVRGSPKDAVYRGYAFVNQYSEAGTWRLKNAYLTDNLDNHGDYYEEELISLGLAATFEVASAQQDFEPPSPVELTLHSNSADVTGGPGQIGVTLKATDDLSGVAWAQLDFVSPSKDTELTLGGPSHEGWESIDDGLFVGALTVPQASEAGTWSIKWIHLTDHTENVESYHSSYLQPLGLFVTFEVTEELRQGG